MRMDTKKVILSRLLPKTGQTISDRTGDDGDYQVGWWKGKTVANNKKRLVDVSVGDDSMIFDRVTGLIWPTERDMAGGNFGNELSWNDAIDYCLALDFGGFTDWRLPNVLELLSIVNFGAYNPATYRPEFDLTGAIHWTSTRYKYVIDKYWCVSFISGDTTTILGVDPVYIIAVRGGK